MSTQSKKPCVPPRYDCPSQISGTSFLARLLLVALEEAPRSSCLFVNTVFMHREEHKNDLEGHRTSSGLS